MLAFQTTNMLLTRVFIRTVHGRDAFDTSPRITGHVYTTAACAQLLFFSLYGRPPPALRVSVKRRVNPAAAGPLVSLLHRTPPAPLLLSPCCPQAVRASRCRAHPLSFSRRRRALTNERSRQKPSNSGGEAAGPFLLLHVLLRHARTPHTLHRVRIREASAFPRQPLPFPRHTPLPPLRGLFFMPCTTRHTILLRPARLSPPPSTHTHTHSHRSFTPAAVFGFSGAARFNP